MDRVILEGIHILLKRMPIWYAVNYADTDLWAETGREIFIREFLRKYNMYTEDEVNHMYGLIIGEEELPDMVFQLLRKIAEEYLYMNGKDICCYQSKIVEFREVSMGIGQSIFISAFESGRNVRLGTDRILPHAAPVIRSDDLRLRHILSNGYAENHFHLNGSAPTALLSWVCLMNHPVGRSGEFKAFNERRNFFPSLEEDIGSSLYEDIVNAAAIRLLLYYIMKDCQKEAEKVQKWLEFYRDGIESIGGLQILIDGEHILLEDPVFDYIEAPMQEMEVFYPISGEHQFLVKLFACVLNRDTRIKNRIGDVYAYLLIYCRFYGEMIQSNQAVGFYNFMRYQDRKEIFLEQYPRYSYQVKKMALEMALESKSLLSLEARITPKATRRELVLQQKLFSDKIFACGSQRCGHCEYFNDVLENCNIGYCIKVFARLSFLYHFVKLPDQKYKEPEKGINVGDLKCRHYNLRRKNIWPVIQLFSKLRKEEMVFDHVYGLDACNREIGCRPEVFAPYFRYAREQDSYVENDLFAERNLPKLKITFHVGEDFLDILDGLRAVEEAVQFLELKRGDRIGHALALGVNAKQWYREKKMRVYLSRQDYLDNLVFLYYMLMENHLNYPLLHRELESEFKKNLKLIYPDRQSSSIEEYYLSMQLRGDEPELYAAIGRDIVKELEGEWKFRKHNLTENARDSREAVALMHDYHYSQRAKFIGSRPMEQKITEEYIEAVAEVQNIMCRKVAEAGIGIECNPSSNILIGSAKDYNHHPILRFNHYNLKELEKDGIPEMFVSINTDDLGVFDTNLENEYALMACALQQEKNERGIRKFSSEEIYRWIDHVRRMGLEQSFKLSEQIERKGKRAEY